MASASLLASFAGRFTQESLFASRFVLAVNYEYSPTPVVVADIYQIQSTLGKHANGSEYRAQYSMQNSAVAWAMAVVIIIVQPTVMLWFLLVFV
jgi:hypothetical protein